MMDGVSGLGATPPAVPATAAAAPPAGTFLQLLAGGYAAPPLVEAGVPDASSEEPGEPLLSDDDPAGFLSAWFGIAPLPLAANEGAPPAPAAGSTAAARQVPILTPAVPAPPGGRAAAGQGDGLLPLPAPAMEPVTAPALAVAEALGAAALAPAIDASLAVDAAEGLALVTPLSESGSGPRPVERSAAPVMTFGLRVDADFEAALDAQLRWQVDAGLSEAVIDLNPAELGALTIRIQVQGDQTSLQIHAAEAATRQLLQQLLPQMGERLAQSGLSYSGGEVSDRATADDDGAAASPAAPGPRRGRHPVQVHLVDAYA